MKCQKKLEEKEGNLIHVCPTGTSRPENDRSSESSFFHYSIIESHPINYEYGLSPVWTAFTPSAASGLSIEMDLTMKNPEIYFNCTEKYSQSL
ncbi:MAG TPA: hypothetical protein GXX65_10085 [Methanosarcina sp.]|jgi:hypothetical protein|nr:hypothetical protein [Methanosarcina sp.]